MPSLEVEHPSPPPHQHLAMDDVELIGWRYPASRHASHTPVIDIDDEDVVESGPPTNRRRVTGSRNDPVFVIEDMGDDATHRNPSTDGGGQNRPIVVLDSDEEERRPSGSALASSSRSRPRRGGVRIRGGRNSTPSFRIFSPSPPPPQRHPIPPVPHIPPIIAGALPFALLPPPPNNAPGRNRLPFDEPPQPATAGTNSGGGSGGPSGGIHLGGGLFSQGSSSGRHSGPRAQIHFQPRRSELFEDLFDEFADDPPPPNPRGASSASIDRFSRFGRFFASYLSSGPFAPGTSSSNAPRPQARIRTGGQPPRAAHHRHDDIGVLDLRLGAGHADFFGLSVFSPWGRRDAALGIGQEYEKSMTHPDRAGPGWTFDFGTEQDEEGGAAKVDGSEILVCAKCLDPLLANADGMVDVSEEEKKERRVWALRCGHVLDGKCVGVLMRPEAKVAVVEPDGDGVPEGKGKDKGKAKGRGRQMQVDSVDADEMEVTEMIDVPDVKGKGKAPAVPIHAPTPPPLHYAPVHLAPTEVTSLDPPPEDTSIRSRLRPRRAVFPPPSSPTSTSSPRHRRSNHVPATPNVRIPPTTSPSSPRRRGTKRKHNSDGEEVVEARHEWTCPVSGCGRVHESIKVGGVWKMQPERGAVGIYV